MSAVPQSWCYLKVNIDNLAVVSQELLAAFSDIFPNHAELSPDYIHVWRRQIESKIPETIKFLEQLNLLNRWSHTAFITGNHGTSLPLHVDNLDPISRSYALNIPVLNCQHSYTVFYNAEILGPIFESDDVRTTAYYCNKDTAVEIARLESSEPAWVNVSKPHQPIMNHNLPRVIASFRFHPEIHDYFDNAST